MFGLRWHFRYCDHSFRLRYFLIVFYATVITFAGYLVAADSGLRGMIEVWIDIVVFVRSHSFCSMQGQGLILGLALSAMLLVMYFFTRQRVLQALQLYTSYRCFI